MKLDFLLLTRAAALGDRSTILQIFAGHFPEVRYYCNMLNNWTIMQNGWMPAYYITLETPFGSFHCSRGQFYTGDHIGAYAIIYGREFVRCAIL